MFLFDAMQGLKDFWTEIQPLVQGVSIGAILTACLSSISNSLIKKAFGKVDYEKIVNDTRDNALNKIGQTTLNVNITPVVKHEVKNAIKESKEDIDNQINDLQKQIDVNNKMLMWICNVYKNSISISDEQRNDLDNIKPVEKEEKQEEIKIIDIKGITSTEPTINEVKAKGKSKVQEEEVVR